MMTNLVCLMCRASAFVFFGKSSVLCVDDQSAFGVCVYAPDVYILMGQGVFCFLCTAGVAGMHCERTLCLLMCSLNAEIITWRLRKIAFFVSYSCLTVVAGTKESSRSPFHFSFRLSAPLCFLVCCFFIYVYHCMLFLVYNNVMSPRNM